MSFKVVVFIFVTISYVHSKIYNTETYTIRPHDSRIIVDKVDSKYFVLNVGRPNVTIEIIHGDNSRWRGYLEKRVLSHGQSRLFTVEQRKMYKAVKVINDADTVAYVHAWGIYWRYPEFDDRTDNYFKLDSNELAQTIVSTAAAYVPYVGEILESVVEFFWPEKEESVWEKIEEQVSDLIDEKTRNAVQDILKGDLDQFRSRIKYCSYEITHPNITKTILTHYINIAEDLIGLERKFVFDSSNDAPNLNFFILPLYSAVINLKLNFYQYGIKNKHLLKLSSEHINRLKHYMYDVVNEPRKGAIAHVNKTCKDKLDYEYEHIYPENIFDQLASVREFCALSGLEHIPVWKSMAADPLVSKKPEIPVIVYSTQFGRNTASQSSEMVKPNYPSLTPKIIKGKLDHPTQVVVFLTSSNRIGGLRIAHASGNAVYVGPTISRKTVKVDFQGKKLMKLTARGTGQIDALEFTFEDGRVVKAGAPQGQSRTFSLPDHHIIGFFMTGSLLRIPDDQAANIAVSYQLIVKD